MEEEDEQDVDDVDDKIDIANNEEGRGVVLGEKEKEAETKRRSEPGGEKETKRELGCFIEGRAGKSKAEMDAASAAWVME